MTDQESIVLDIPNIDESEEFPLTINKLNSILYSEQVTINSKGGRVTKELLVKTKTIIEKINTITLNMYKKLTVAETKLVDRDGTNKILRNLAEDINRLKSTSESPKLKEIDYSIIITPKGGTGADDLKSDIKQMGKRETQLPKPKDVIKTKNDQLILKLRNKNEVEVMRKALLEKESIKDNSRITTSKRGRDRLILLSVSKEIEEEDLAKILGEELDEQNMDYEIERKLVTKAGNHNWVINVDERAKSYLLARKRICIDYERIRVVEYIQITRCYRCQKFGHTSYKCENAQVCPKCVENHAEKECKSEVLKCGNCYFEGAESDIEHRADSKDCQFYKTYRATLARRL